MRRAWLSGGYSFADGVKKTGRVPVEDAPRFYGGDVPLFGVGDGDCLYAELRAAAVAAPVVHQFPRVAVDGCV